MRRSTSYRYSEVSGTIEDPVRANRAGSFCMSICTSFSGRSVIALTISWKFAGCCLSALYNRTFFDYSKRKLIPCVLSWHRVLKEQKMKTSKTIKIIIGIVLAGLGLAAIIFTRSAGIKEEASTLEQVLFALSLILFLIGLIVVGSAFMKPARPTDIRTSASLSLRSISRSRGRRRRPLSISGTFSACSRRCSSAASGAAWQVRSA